MQRVRVTLLALAVLSRAAAAATPLAEPGDARTISAVASLARWFAEQIRSDQLAAAEKLRKLDKKAYLNAIAARRATAMACARDLPAEVAAEIEGFLSTSDAASEDAHLQRALAAIAGQPRKVVECVGATMVKLNGRTVMLGGIFPAPTVRDRSSATSYDPGQVYILRPQVVTAWPGRDDSALAVLDPRDGPWTVVRAQTLIGGSRSWISRGRVSVAEYLRRTNGGYFLLVDDKQDALGWLPMDRAAFFPRDRSKNANEARRVYLSGAATFLQGVWWNPDGFCELGKPGDEQCGVPRQDVVYINDFLALVQGRMPLAIGPGGRARTIRDPYPTEFDIARIGRAYVARPELQFRLSVAIERLAESDTAPEPGPGGIVFAGNGAPTGTVGNANRRTTLEGLRQVSASRERRP